MLKWFNIKTNSIWAGVLLSLRMMAGLAMQKIVAIKFGPSGTALFSHFQNLLSIFTQPLQDIIGQGLISAYSKNKFDNKPRLIGNALILGIYITVSLSVLIVIFQHTALSYFPFNSTQWLLLFLSLLLFSIQLLLANYLIAKRNLKTLSLLFLAQWFLIILLLSVPGLSIIELLFYYALIQGGFTIVYFIVIVIDYTEIRKLTFNLDAKLLHHFKQFLLIGLTIWISSKLTDYFVRDYALSNFGTSETGYWQSAARISEALKGLLISFLMMTVYPAFAAIENKVKLQSFMKKQLTNMLLIIPLALLILYWLSPLVLQLLYSKGFSDAVPLFRLHLLGDLFALFSFPFALLLMAKVETKNYILAEGLSVLSYILIIFLLKNQGIEKIIYAYIARSFIYLICTISFSKKLLKFG